VLSENLGDVWQCVVAVKQSVVHVYMRVVELIDTSWQLYMCCASHMERSAL
jgi:hypothetical protein